MSASSPVCGVVPPWMICDALLGVVQGGMVPVILPLAAHPGPTAGLTYGAFAATGIAAPFISIWSDRHRKHRLTLACGLGLAGLSLLAHALPGATRLAPEGSACVGITLRRHKARVVGTAGSVKVSQPQRDLAPRGQQLKGRVREAGPADVKRRVPGEADALLRYAQQ